MSIINNIITTLIESRNVEKETVRKKIEKYLHRVKFVNDLKTLTLLRQIAAFLINQSKNSLRHKDLELNNIRQNM
jgi:NifB/MoaA-like Fe-S oxidoreductase